MDGYPPSPGAPPYPPYARHRYRRRRGIVLPVLLITVGVIFLLQNFGVLSWGVWGSLWHLWPLGIILIGLDMFLGGAGRGVAGLLVLAVFAAAVAAALYGATNGVGENVFRRAASTGPTVSNTLTQDLQGASSASVNLRMGPGNLSVGALASGGTELAQMSYSGPKQFAPQSTYRVANGAGQLSYGGRGGPAGGSGGQIELDLSPSVPLTMEVQGGASTINLDLTKLRVTNLDLQMGAATATVQLPEAAGTTTAVIKGGASTINVIVPPDVAAQVTYQGGLSTLSVDTSRFQQIGNNSYRSANYDTAKNKADVTIQAGVATVNVR